MVEQLFVFDAYVYVRSFLYLVHVLMLRQAYPRMGKALLMAGELEQADDAFRLGMRKVRKKEIKGRRSRWSLLFSLTRSVHSADSIYTYVDVDGSKAMAVFVRHQY